jgi:hypothetical protein
MQFQGVAVRFLHLFFSFIVPLYLVPSCFVNPTHLLFLFLAIDLALGTPLFEHANTTLRVITNANAGPAVNRPQTPTQEIKNGMRRMQEATNQGTFSCHSLFGISTPTFHLAVILNCILISCCSVMKRNRLARHVLDITFHASVHLQRSPLPA